MSVEAITWALQQAIHQSSAKFVLVVMANCADGNGVCWPSIGYLADATGQDRKTVIANIKRLRDTGWIADTGERKGGTGQIIVYRLGLNSPNFPGKESQKRNDTKNGTVPNFPTNSPNFPGKESRFSVETVPKTEPGTVSKPKEPSENHQDAGAERKAPDPSPPAPPPVVCITLNDGSEHGITETQVAEWSTTYPAVDVLQQLRQMRQWCIANPSRRKTRRGVLTFIVTWLGKEQDKGRNMPPRFRPASVVAASLQEEPRDVVSRI